jgi:hypothetical protein
MRVWERLGWPCQISFRNLQIIFPRAYFEDGPVFRARRVVLREPEYT